MVVCGCHFVPDLSQVHEQKSTDVLECRRKVKAQKQLSCSLVYGRNALDRRPHLHHSDFCTGETMVANAVRCTDAVAFVLEKLQTQTQESMNLLTILNYCLYQLKKFRRIFCWTNVVIALLWGALYYLTDWETVSNYFFIGILVCAVNTLIYNISLHRMVHLLWMQYQWMIMAGVVLVLYHAGFTAAAVFAAAAILISPFFWASIYEGIVGLSLLLMLAKLMF